MTLCYKEVFRFLSSECRAYLPNYDNVTIFHLKDIASGVKRMIKCEDVKVINIPQFEGLKIEAILEYATAHQEVLDALPT
jgi:hypothetical protein